MTSQTHELHDPEFELADRLRRVRRGAHLNQADFARSIGAKEKAYAAWESGTNEPRDVVGLAKRIQLAYGVRASWVLGLTGDGSPGGEPSPHPEGGLTEGPAGTENSRGRTTGRARRYSKPQPSDPKVLPLRRAA